MHVHRSLRFAFRCYVARCVSLHFVQMDSQRPCSLFRQEFDPPPHREMKASGGEEERESGS